MTKHAGNEAGRGAKIIQWASKEELYNGGGHVINPEIFDEAASKIISTLAAERDRLREALVKLHSFVRTIPLDVLPDKKQDECWACDKAARAVLHPGKQETD